MSTPNDPPRSATIAIRRVQLVPAAYITRRVPGGGHRVPYRPRWTAPAEWKSAVRGEQITDYVTDGRRYGLRFASGGVLWLPGTTANEAFGWPKDELR